MLLTGNHSKGIESMIARMNIPNTLIKLELEWTGSPKDINEHFQAVVDKLVKATLITFLNLNLDFTRFNDEGCASIAQLLQSSKTVSSFFIEMSISRITDIGLSYIAFELPFIPLRELGLSLCKTKITDQGIISLSQTFRRTSSKLHYILLRIDGTFISDTGIMALIDALTCLRTLTKLVLSLGE
eukprot:TRINITY_DN22212_c0_g1_i2.p1 TRINITY_DN22212_c0_g1~~TRINITY_DN22212_c0_g1_i2.p1  ORF type:complete len:185 (-),score=13.13 TRINITY_DN22212_c0_g1_i2:203-757(-)